MVKSSFLGPQTKKIRLVVFLSTGVLLDLSKHITIIIIIDNSVTFKTAGTNNSVLIMDQLLMVVLL